MATPRTDVDPEDEKRKKYNLRRYNLNDLLHSLENPILLSGSKDSAVRYRQFAATISKLTQNLDTANNQIHALLADILFSSFNIQNALKSEKLYPLKMPAQSPPRNTTMDKKFLSSDKAQEILDQLSEKLSPDAIQSFGILLRAATGQEKTSPFRHQGR